MVNSSPAREPNPATFLSYHLFCLDPFVSRRTSRALRLQLGNPPSGASPKSTNRLTCSLESPSSTLCRTWSSDWPSSLLVTCNSPAVFGGRFHIWTRIELPICQSASPAKNMLHKMKNQNFRFAPIGHTPRRPRIQPHERSSPHRCTSRDIIVRSMATKGARTSSAAWGEDRVSGKYGLPKVSTRGSTVGKKARVGGKRSSTPRAHVSSSEKGTRPQEMKAKWV